VDVVHQVHDGATGHQRAAEGQAVLDVDHEAWTVAQHMQKGARVHAQVTAPAHDVHPAEDLLGRCPVVGGAEHRDAEPRPRQPFGHAVDVAFRAPAFGVSDVPPVDEEDIDRR
jgi:hypothetical protein